MDSSIDDDLVKQAAASDSPDIFLDVLSIYVNNDFLERPLVVLGLDNYVIKGELIPLRQFIPYLGVGTAALGPGIENYDVHGISEYSEEMIQKLGGKLSVLTLADPKVNGESIGVSHARVPIASVRWWGPVPRPREDREEE